MRAIEELRKDFEKTKLFIDIDSTIRGINYKNEGGYFVDGKPCFYLNGALAMYVEVVNE